MTNLIPRPTRLRCGSRKLLCCLPILLLCSCTNPSDTPSSLQDIKDCQPTQYDEIGPFYRPGAPIRNKVGEGYLLKGTVMSEKKCTPLPKATIEFWLANSKSEYDDAHRATVIADAHGNYTFESNIPPIYVGRLPHIHMRITAKDHQELITQHYPKQEEKQAEFNIVLETAPATK